MSFGERLTTARKRKGYTQEQLAKEIGVAKSTITGYEKNNREPDALKIHALAKALEVSGDELLGIEPKQNVILAETAAEEAILINYRKLNREGQIKLEDYAEDLTQTGRYIKTDTSGMGAKYA